MRFIPSRRAGATLVVAAVAAGSVAVGVAPAATSLRIGSKKQCCKFTKKRMAAQSGRVTIALRVPRGSNAPHAIAVRGRGLNKASKVVQRGTTRVTVRLRKGRYTFYCPVGQHAKNGMRGRLVVG
jgi:plastocyanin